MYFPNSHTAIVLPIRSLFSPIDHSLLIEEFPSRYNPTQLTIVLFSSVCHPLQFCPAITVAPKTKTNAIMVNQMLSPSMDLDHIPLADRDCKIVEKQCEFDLF